MDRSKYFTKVIGVVLGIMALLIFSAEWAFAHSPHHVIGALILSPNYGLDKILFAVLAGVNLQRSMDGGYSWKLLARGLDNRSSFSFLAVSPSYQDDRTLYVSTEGDGIYRSEDGGDSWAQINKGLGDLNISYVWVSPEFGLERSVFCAGIRGGLYKAGDGGGLWYPVIEEGVRVMAMGFWPGGGVLVGEERGRLRFSKDGGETWHRSYEFGDPGSVTAIAVSPSFSRDNTVFVGTEKGGVFKSEDGGKSFAGVNEGLTNKMVRWVALSPEYERDSTLFVSTWYEAVFCSTDGGKRWEHFKEGLTTNKQADSEQYKSPHFRDLRISNTFVEDRTMFLAGFDGLFKSVDGGRRWEQLETMPVKMVTGLGVSAKGRDRLEVAVGTYNGGIYMTRDGGQTWSIANKGLPRTRPTDIVFSPEGGTVFTAVSGFLLKSSNGGRDWLKFGLHRKSWGNRIRSRLTRLGIPDRLLNLCLGKIENRGTPYPTAIAISPDFHEDRTLFFGTRKHGVFKSVDGGLHSEAVWDGMGRVIPSLAISPAFPEDATLFASVRNQGVYKTPDGGETWHAVNAGLEGPFAKGSTGKSADPMDIELAVSPDYRADQTVFAGSSGGLFKTEDGGTTWHPLYLAGIEKHAFIRTVALSPAYAKDRTVLVSVKGRGLFRSSDGGQSFVETGRDLIAGNYCLRWMAFSPFYPLDRIVYGACDAEVFQSTNSGETWRLLSRPARYEDSQSAIRYKGAWKVLHGEDFSASTARHSEVSGSRAGLTFVGTGVTWVGGTGKDHGIARVLIDGEYVAEADQFSEERRVMAPVYSIEGLPPGPHTVEVEVRGSRNPRSTGFSIEIEAFDVFP
jgi:photosystem II stability/assembly factor-like uncharacterized protein